MRFLHTADWHLGRQLFNQSLIEDQARMLRQVVGAAVTHQVDAVLIAGDIYDRSLPPEAAVRLLSDTLDELVLEHRIPVVMITGNHDGRDRLGFASRPLAAAGVHIISSLSRVTEPVVITDAAREYHIYGIPYVEPVEVTAESGNRMSGHAEAHAHLVSRVTSVMSGQAVNLLLSHCFVAGGESSDSEKTLSVGGADQVAWEPMKAFDYVALGHLHAPQSRGVDYIRYAGSPLKYSFSEARHRKSLTLVDFADDGSREISQIPIEPLHDVRIIEGLFDELLSQAGTDPGVDDYLLVRLADTGPVLNAMLRLRDAYPNVLHLEKPGLASAIPSHSRARSTLNRSEFELFGAFFREVTGESMSDAQCQCIRDTLDNLRQEAES